MRHQAANGRGAVADDGVGGAPDDEIFFVGAAGSVNGVRSPAQRVVRQRWPGEATVEAEIDPIVLAVALAPPEHAIGVADAAGAFAQLDQIEQRIGQRAGENI